MPVRYVLINAIPVTITAAAFGWILGDLIW